MEIKNYSQASHSLYRVTHSGAKIDELITVIPKAGLPLAEKYAYQAFCYAMLAKDSSSILQKGKYIQQYGEFINKAIVINENCYEARLLRFIVERKLENVKFVSHQEIDKNFLFANMDLLNDDCLKHITQKTLANE